MANKKITELPAASDLTGAELYEVVQGGINKKATQDLNNPYRGDWAGTTAFPSTGGRYTSGAPMRGDKWRLTGVLVVGGNVYDIGTVVEAAINNAGATTVSDWIKYAVQP